MQVPGDGDETSRYTELVGHTGFVRSVAALPGDALVSGGNDKTVRVWRKVRVQDNEKTSDQRWVCEAKLKGHTGTVYAVAALPNGCVASASGDCTIRIWHRPTSETKRVRWECVAVLDDHTNRVTCLLALPDGTLVSGSNDLTVRVWRRRDPASPSSDWLCAAVLRGHDCFIWKLSPVFDGDFVSSDVLGTVHLWRRANPMFAWSSWQKAVVARDTTVLIRGARAFAGCCAAYELADECVHVYHQPAPYAPKPPKRHVALLDCTADGLIAVALISDDCLVTADKRGMVQVWRRPCSDPRPTAWNRAEILKERAYCVADIAVLSDGRLVTCAYDRKVLVWAPMTSREWGARAPVVMLFVVASRRGWGIATPRWRQS